MPDGATSSRDDSIARVTVGPFPEPLEDAFQADYFERSLPRIRTSLLMAILLFIVFSVLDYWLVPDAFVPLSVLRFGGVIPFLIGTLAFTYSPRFRAHLQVALVSCVLVGSIGIIGMTALAGEGGARLYYAGLLLAIAWTHGLTGLSFRNATWVSWAAVGAYLVMTSAAGMPAPILISNMFFIVAAILIGMLVSYHNEQAFRRDFLQRRLLQERTDEAQASMAKLRDAQTRLAEMERAAPQAAEDLPGWAAATAREIARAVEATEVRVWEIHEDEVRPLTPGFSTAPTADDIRADEAAVRDARGRLLVRIVGLTGDLYGAVVVAGAAVLDDDAMRLVGGFARQLGGAIEVHRMRTALEAAERRREATRLSMEARGVRTLRLCPACGRCHDDSIDRCLTDGTPLVRRLIPYHVQDRYQLVRLLGQGGMGLVFHATDDRLGRDVAMKVLRADLHLDQDIRRQLAHEARAAARINHPGIVEVYDLGELDDGSSFLVMELLEGRSLGDLLAEGARATPAEAAAFLRQTAAALGAAHRLDLIHRDLKPQNIFLVADGGGFVAKLLDFGLARHVGMDETTETRPGTLLGTPAYMAPEQIRGGRLDARADLYSLAAVAFEVVTGRRLVDQASLHATLFAVVNEPPPRISTFVRGVSSAVDEAFLAALAKDPELRPHDVEGWVASFAEALEAMPSDAPGWTRQIRRPVPG